MQHYVIRHPTPNINTNAYVYYSLQYDSVSFLSLPVLRRNNTIYKYLYVNQKLKTH